MQHVEPTPQPTASHFLGVLRRLGLYIFMVLWAARHLFGGGLSYMGFGGTGA